MDTLTVILSQAGYYLVGTLTGTGLDAMKVTEDLRCACGGTSAIPCAHVEVVKCYLRLERKQAPPVEVTPSHTDLPEACPVCGAPVIPQADHWRCSLSASHYWLWRGEHSGVKAFLTQPHPAKAGAFYEQTIAERDAFLEQAHQRMVANGYTPYG
jgi:hypothetical protein